MWSLKIPDDFLCYCMSDDEDEIISVDSIVDYITADLPDLGEHLNAKIDDFIRGVVEEDILPEAEEYAKDYYEESARDEAMRDLRREFYESCKNTAEYGRVA